ncbi:MAG: hypothetical protein HC877_17335 [Thioploca sp.]|nr:hypothetical protein [Thioploca sp.]
MSRFKLDQAVCQQFQRPVVMICQQFATNQSDQTGLGFTLNNFQILEKLLSNNANLQNLTELPTVMELENKYLDN